MCVCVKGYWGVERETLTEGAATHHFGALPITNHFVVFRSGTVHGGVFKSHLGLLGKEIFLVLEVIKMKLTVVLPFLLF